MVARAIGNPMRQSTRETRPTSRVMRPPNRFRRRWIRRACIVMCDAAKSAMEKTLLARRWAATRSGIETNRPAGGRVSDRGSAA